MVYNDKKQQFNKYINDYFDNIKAPTGTSHTTIWNVLNKVGLNQSASFIATELATLR